MHAARVRVTDEGRGEGVGGCLRACRTCGGGGGGGEGDTVIRSNPSPNQSTHLLISTQSP